MCIGIPLRVITSTPGHALCEGRGETREVETALVGPCAPGDWLLTFLGSARERLSAERAAVVNATLDLLAAVMGHPGDAGDARGACDEVETNLGFALPSAMHTDQVAALTGRPVSHSTETTP
jgi:hydrogenase expression/formation protein HypC